MIKTCLPLKCAVVALGGREVSSSASVLCAAPLSLKSLEGPAKLESLVSFGLDSVAMGLSSPTQFEHVRGKRGKCKKSGTWVNTQQSLHYQAPLLEIGRLSHL